MRQRAKEQRGKMILRLAKLKSILSGAIIGKLIEATLGYVTLDTLTPI